MGLRIFWGPNATDNALTNMVNGDYMVWQMRN